MQERDDNVLLREYVERNSEEAFAALLARHINKVYSVALRHARNPHQAEEITQAVFVILAKKSRHLGPGVVLSGWLYQTARLTAVTFLRTEIRRARREQEAHMQTLLNETEPDVWPQIAPLLDAAMAGLNETDRHAVVLRFFDGRSMSEVGAALGASEDAAKKRVHRAVDKLRLFFTKRGVVLPAAALTAAISANSVQAAPALLVKTTAAVVLAKGATASGSTLTLIQGALKLMAWTKVKTTVTTAVILLVVGGATTVIITQGKNPAADSPPAAAPTADSATPKGVLLVMSQAMAAGDAAKYTGSFAFATPDELKLKATLEQLVAGNARFRQALAEKFGLEAANRVFSRMPFVIPSDVVKSGVEKITGDSATVEILGGAKGGRPIQFTKINGEWKMAADGFWHISPLVMNDLLGRLMKSLDATMADIPRDKFKTPMEAVEQMKRNAE